MIFRTALKNIRNGILLNAVAVLQMIAAMVITAVLISAILLRFQYYTPMKEYFSATKGFYGIFPGMANKGIQEGMTMDNLLLDDDRLKAELDKPSEVIGSGFTFCSLPNGKELNSFAYTDNLVQHFTPELSSGHWLSPANEAQSLEVVVSQNKYNWKVGDEITLSFYGTEYTFQIVGMLQENAKIPNGYTNHPGDINYMQFFQTYSFEIEEKPVVLMNLEMLKKLHDGPDILRAMTASYIVTYPTDYPDEKLKTEQAKLASFGSAVTIPLSEMQENNIHYLYRQAYDQLPIIIVLLVLTCVSCISSSAITTRSRLRDYSIYYVCGLQWKQCIIVNLVQSLLCGVVSYIVSITLLQLMMKTNLFNQFRVIWSWYTIAGMGVVLVVYVIASLIMPLMIIGNNTPKQILSR